MKNRFRSTLRWMIHMTLNCVRLTQSSVIQNIYLNVGLKCFFHLPECLFAIIVVHSYFSNISHGSVETYLQCGAIYNNHIFANCSHSVPVKKNLKIV